MTDRTATAAPRAGAVHGTDAVLIQHLTGRPARLHAAVNQVAEEDSELLGRLGR